MNSGYRALREGAAWIDLSGRGVIRATGEDRARLLHAMTTNDVQRLKPGESCYAFFLNAQGRILADVNLLRLEDAFLLDTEPETREFVYQHLDKYIIADDVTLEDETERTAVIGIEGPGAAGVLASLGNAAPMASASATGLAGYRLFVPVAGKADLAARLEAAGAVKVEPDAVRLVRIEQGRPRYGEDISDRNLPQETQLMHAVSFEKGCYLGQEIVERVRSRGGVHRFLVRLAIESDAAPAAGTKLTAGGKEAGEITSAAYSPAMGKVAALGYVRAEYLAAATALEAAGAPAAITATRPN